MDDKKYSCPLKYPAKKRVPTLHAHYYELGRAIARAEKHMDSLLSKILDWEKQRREIQSALAEQPKGSQIH